MNDMMTVLYIQVGKKPQVIRIRHMLSEMQRLVGGTISSFTPFDDGSVMIVNDNGKNEGLEFNRTVRDKKGKVIDIYKHYQKQKNESIGGKLSKLLGSNTNNISLYISFTLCFLLIIVGIIYFWIPKNE